MVLHMAFHIHKQKTEEKIDLQGTCAQSVVPYIFLEPYMLQPDKGPHEKRPVKSRQAEEKNREPALKKYRSRHGRGVHKQDRPGGAVHFFYFPVRFGLIIQEVQYFPAFLPAHRYFKGFRSVPRRKRQDGIFSDQPDKEFFQSRRERFCNRSPCPHRTPVPAPAQSRPAHPEIQHLHRYH